MKVLHLNTKDTGGAAAAALRLHQSLIHEEVSSIFLCLQREQNIAKNVHSFTPNRNLSFTSKLFLRLGWKKERHQINNEKLKGLTRNYELFSFPTTDIDITESPLYQEADIIHLHWVPRFLDYSTFFKKNTKPLVWTLHDMNPFMGGVHYQGDLDRNQSKFATLEAELLAVKQNALRNIKDLTIVAPSMWMLQKSEKSSVLGKFKHVHIPNGVPINTFKPFNKAFCKSVFNLPESGKILLFISDNIYNQRKGFDILLDSIANIDQEEIFLCAVGNSKESRDAIFQINNVQDERLMNLIYNAADAFVLPSREDNFPNVVLEATSCGVPVITVNNGGATEIIKNGFNGIVADDISSDALSKSINSFSTSQFDSEKIRNYTAQHYASEIIAKRYIDLYQNVLAQSD